MQVKIVTDELSECQCGHTPTHFLIGYGSTPYNLSCKCGKSLHSAKCKITGGSNNLVDYWNKYLSITNLKNIKKDKDDFLKEKKELVEEEGYEPREYQYYWYEHLKGEYLAKTWI